MNPNMPSAPQGPQKNEAHIDYDAFVSGEGVDNHLSLMQQIESAAIHLDKTNTPPARTSDRDGYWTRPTDEQIDRAKLNGFDLSKQNKYY
ncbi:hypothetical protein KDA11_02970 [Candidatus Saccharibacteria bacterium]|nr:hypothetical protein [Candidatus Saccharibacteria bacterium]